MVIAPGDGTTIAQAIARLADGGTLTLRGGTYSEFVSVNRSVTIQAYPGETPIIQAPIGAQSAVMEINADNVTLQGITVDSTNRHRGIDANAGSDNLLLENCTIQNCVGGVSGEYGQGIVINAACDTATIRNCTFTNIHGIDGEETFSHGIYTAIPNLLVEGCTFEGISGNGVNFYGGDGTYIIRNNQMTNCGAGVGVYRGTGEVYGNEMTDCDYGVIANYNVISVDAHDNTVNNAFIGITSSNWGVGLVSVLFTNNIINVASNAGFYSEFTGTLTEGQSVTVQENQFISCVTPVSLVADAATEVTLIDNEILP